MGDSVIIGREPSELSDEDSNGYKNVFEYIEISLFIFLLT